MELLRAEDLSIEFGGLKAVQDFNLSMGERDLLAIIGPNGAGKTTVFNMLTGIYKPTSGTIVMDGKVMNGLKPHQFAACGIARTFQNIRLFGAATVLDNLLIAMDMQLRYGFASAVAHGRKYHAQEREIRKKADEILDFFELREKEDMPAKHLPYGQQRRLEIARALATNPKIVCLDEPAAGMNPQEVIELMQLVKQMRETFQVSILLIEHHMSMVMAIADRIKVIDFGVTIAEGLPLEVQNDPLVIEAYLGKEVEQDA